MPSEEPGVVLPCHSVMPVVLPFHAHILSPGCVLHSEQAARLFRQPLFPGQMSSSTKKGYQRKGGRKEEREHEREELVGG